jgi:hypothetical protein
MTSIFARLAVIMDRALHLLISNGAPIAICMAPAVLLNVAALALYPGDVVPAAVSSDNVSTSPYFRAYLVFAGAVALATFSQWVCASTVMLGVRWIERGYPPKPLVWLRIGFQRTPALLVTFVLPIVPALVPLCLYLMSLYRLYQMIGSIHAIDPTSLEFQLEALPYEVWGAVVLGALGLPLAYLATAGVILGDLTAFRAVAAAVRCSFSRKQIKRFLAFSFAVVALVSAQWSAETVLRLGTQYMPSAEIAWHAIQYVVELAFTAYGAVLVALAWLSGFIGPDAGVEVSL